MAGGTKSSSPVDIVDAGGNLNSGTVFDGSGTADGIRLSSTGDLETGSVNDGRKRGAFSSAIS